MKKLASFVFLLVILKAFCPNPNSCLTAAERVVTMKPKLVVAIVVDQFRYDYLLRFKNDYNSGLQQLVSKGAVFTNARYEHYPTYTSVGHAAFLTGAFPGVNGIVGNTWYDRYSGKLVPSASDEEVRLVGGSEGKGSSPRNLLVSTIGDELKIAEQGKSKVFGVSLKDYSIILATGHMADAAYWFDGKSGNFVSSSYYLNDLPEWLNAFNRKRPADKYKNQEWLGTKLPAEANSKLYGMLASTPFGNDMVEEMAEEVIKAEKLGSRPQTDFLVLSFSANDFVGHFNGPDSPQVREISIATDKMLGRLFKFIDSQIGMKNVTVVLTADHGVAPMPELNVERKMPGGRMPLDVLNVIQKALIQKFGEGKWIASAPEDGVYLNRDLIEEKKLKRDEVASVAAQAALALPHVFRVYTGDQLERGAAMEDQIGRSVMRSYSQRRSADLYVLLEAYYQFGKFSTTHGTAFSYDNHVPLIFMGPGIRAGRFHSNVVINDVAPTLATILEIEMPSGAEGRILSEIFVAP